MSDWKENPNHLGHLWWIGQGLSWCGFWMSLGIIFSSIVSCNSANYEYIDAKEIAIKPLSERK